MAISQRNGVHPFDDALADVWLLGWIMPSLQVLQRNIRRIAPVALAYGVYVWLLPHLLLSGGSVGLGARIVDSIQVSAVLTAFMAFGYIGLVRGEGEPHGLAYVAPTRSIAERLALIALFWLVFGVVLGWLVEGLLGALMKSPSFLETAMWLFSKLNWWSIPFVLWLFSPIGFWLATVSALTQIRAIRGEEPVNEIVVDSFRRVFAEPLRIAVPAYLLVAAGIFALYIFAEMIFNGLAALLLRAGWAAVIGMVAVSMALALPFWFVIERVYAPELGLEDDVQIGLEDAGEQLPAVISEASLADQLGVLRAEQDAPAVARQVANWVRAHHGNFTELQALFQQLGQPELLARELSVVAIEWLTGKKSGDLPWLVEQGLAMNPAFMMDAPDHVLQLSKKLTAADRADLASRLLLSMLKLQRGHADHLAAGLQLARVLATHSNNAEGARKLLGQLAKLYPDEPQIAQMVKLLG